MFPLQKSGELCFKVASKSNSPHPHHHHRAPKDLMLLDHSDHDPLAESKVVVFADGVENSSRRRKICAIPNENENAIIVDEESARKKKHREIEKQRRQEMATLYTALRSLLPLEYIRGKRSISDHMNEAVKYIKHLHVKISELSDRRDKLKKLSSSAAFGSTSRDSATSSRDCIVEINHLLDGNEVEIIMSGRSEEDEDNLPLSNLLEFLLDQGLDVVSCFSTKVNDRTLHKIHCQVVEAKFMDLSELRRRLDAAMD